MERRPTSSHPLTEDIGDRLSIGKQPGYFDSALEDADSVSSLDLATLSMPTERIRRRSVLERPYRPGGLFSEPQPQSLRTPEAIELPDLSPVSEYPGHISVPLTNRASSVAIQPEVESVSRWSTRDDLEVASQIPPSVVSATLTPNTAATSSVPLVSASQKAAYMRRSRLHLAALYFTLFLEGWNDGSTGPMLPTIQKYHNVIATRFPSFGKV